MFAVDSFPSKKSSEETRPYFAKLRRVLPNVELTAFAEDIAGNITNYFATLIVCFRNRVPDGQNPDTAQSPDNRHNRD
jgi:hypothetical protein